jgi:hypothetical protein
MLSNIWFLPAYFPSALLTFLKDPTGQNPNAAKADRGVKTMWDRA